MLKFSNIHLHVRTFHYNCKIEYYVTWNEYNATKISILSRYIHKVIQRKII